MKTSIRAKRLSDAKTALWFWIATVLSEHYDFEFPVERLERPRGASQDDWELLRLEALVDFLVEVGAISLQDSH